MFNRLHARLLCKAHVVIVPVKMNMESGGAIRLVRAVPVLRHYREIAFYNLPQSQLFYHLLSHSC